MACPAYPGISVRRRRVVSSALRCFCILCSLGSIQDPFVPLSFPSTSVTLEDCDLVHYLSDSFFFSGRSCGIHHVRAGGEGGGWLLSALGRLVSQNQWHEYGNRHISCISRKAFLRLHIAEIYVFSKCSTNSSTDPLAGR